MVLSTNLLTLSISPTIITLIISAAVAVVIIIILYLLGKRAQKKRDEQQSQIDAAAQTFSMLIIDKKKMKIAEAGFPQSVIEQTPRMAKMRKLPVVKVKIGPKVTPLICDPDIFDMVPVKKEVKGTISGLYLTQVRGIRGSLEVPEKKKTLREKIFGA